MLVLPLLAAVVCIGLADLVCLEVRERTGRASTPAKKAAFDPLEHQHSVRGDRRCFLGVLGALVVTNEYGNGLIRTTLAATPQRGLVLAAKAVLLGLVALAVSAVICFTAFLTGQALLSGGHLPHVSLERSGRARPRAGRGLLHDGGRPDRLVRRRPGRGSAAAAISGVFALLFVLPVLTSGIPDDIAKRDIVPYFPTESWRRAVPLAPGPRRRRRRHGHRGDRDSWPGSWSWAWPRRSRCAVMTPDAPSRGVRGHDGGCAGRGGCGYGHSDRASWPWTWSSAWSRPSSPASGSWDQVASWLPRGAIVPLAIAQGTASARPAAGADGGTRQRRPHWACSCSPSAIRPSRRFSLRAAPPTPWPATGGGAKEAECHRDAARRGRRACSPRSRWPRRPMAPGARNQSGELASFTLGALVAASWVLGYALRTRRDYVAELKDRAARLEAEEGERAARAVVDERLRIARELHDVIGHSISLIAIQSEAAARSVRRPGRGSCLPEQDLGRQPAGARGDARRAGRAAPGRRGGAEPAVLGSSR